MRDKWRRWLAEASEHIGKRFWEVRAATDTPKTGSLYLYGPIWGEALFDDEVAPGKMRKELEALGDIDTLKVFVDSPGGDPFAAAAIYNILRRHPARVHMYVDGLAASAASVVVMAGDKVTMYTNSLLMIHDAWTIVLGNKKELRKEADTLETIDEGIVASYKEKTGLSRRRIVEMMGAETWMGAKEAKELGFADEVEESQAVAASIDGDFLVMNGKQIDLSLFQSRPAWLEASPAPTDSRRAALPPADPPASAPEPEPHTTPTADQQALVSLYAAKLRLNQNRRLAE